MSYKELKLKVKSTKNQLQIICVALDEIFHLMDSRSELVNCQTSWAFGSTAMEKLDHIDQNLANHVNVAKSVLRNAQQVLEDLHPNTTEEETVAQAPDVAQLIHLGVHQFDSTAFREAHPKAANSHQEAHPEGEQDQPSEATRPVSSSSNPRPETMDVAQQEDEASQPLIAQDNQTSCPTTQQEKEASQPLMDDQPSSSSLRPKTMWTWATSQGCHKQTRVASTASEMEDDYPTASEMEDDYPTASEMEEEDNDDLDFDNVSFSLPSLPSSVMSDQDTSEEEEEDDDFNLDDFSFSPPSSVTSDEDGLDMEQDVIVLKQEVPQDTDLQIIYERCTITID